MIKKCLFVVVCFVGLAVYAYWTPFELSVFTPVEVPWGSEEVCGLRLNLVYGRTSDFTGLDIGFSNHVRGDGIGFQLGECNFVTGRFDGFQIAAANFVRRELNGAQVGYFNRSFQEGNGVQIGVVNMADDFCGVQIGLINIIWDSSLVFFPIVNARF